MKVGPPLWDTRQDKGELATMQLEKVVGDGSRCGAASLRIKAAIVASVVLFNCGCTSDGPVRARVASVHKAVKETQRRQTTTVEAVCAAAKTPDRVGSEQHHAVDSSGGCACDASCSEREYQHRAGTMERPNGDQQSSLPLAVIGVWAFSKSGCNLYKANRSEAEMAKGEEASTGIIKITGSEIQKLHGDTASCAILASKISTSQLSISFPARCHVKGREVGQFVIINMHGNDRMRLSFLAAAPFFNTADYVRCAADNLGH
jgi:hypothetical protein